MAIEADVDGRPQLCPLAQDVKARPKRQGFIEAGLGGVHPNEWVRLTAAITLDHLGPAAKPAREQLERAMSDKNQYVVCVVEHALSELP